MNMFLTLVSLVPGLFGKIDDDAVVSKTQLDRAQRERDESLADLGDARQLLADAQKLQENNAYKERQANQGYEKTIDDAERKLAAIRNQLYDVVKREAIQDVALQMGFRDAAKMYKLIPMDQIPIDASDPKHPAVSSIQDVTDLMTELAIGSPYLLDDGIAGPALAPAPPRDFGGSTNPSSKNQPGPRKKFASLEIKRLQGEIDSGDFSGRPLLDKRAELRALIKASRAAGIKGTRSPKRKTGLSLTERLAQKTSQFEQEALKDRNKSLSAQYGKK